MTDNSRSSTSAQLSVPGHESDVPGWDAYAVWRERVRQPVQPGHRPLAPPQGWDPYFVWLSRVRKNTD